MSGMEEADRQLIKDNLDKLSANCNYSNILMFLKIREVFSPRQIQHYESPNFQMLDETEKCRQLFTDIQTRGPNAFQTLLECLLKTGQQTQYDLLKPGRVAERPFSLPTEVKMSESLVVGPNVYKMTSDPKGQYILINNINFYNDCEFRRREGADEDDHFAQVLEDMGFRGSCHRDKTKEEMREELNKFASKETLARVDCCVVVISTHGYVSTSNELAVCGIDSFRKDPASLLCSEIISLFNSDECKLMKHCPKVFIIQACRGDGEVRGNNLLDIPTLRLEHPSWEDTFLLTPSFEGMKSHRDRILGSWIFIALKQVFPNHAHNTDLEKMAELIDDKFQEYMKVDSFTYQQSLSYYEYGVDKKLYFNPGQYSD